LPISPFTDRSINKIGTVKKNPPGENPLATMSGHMFRHAQGVSLKTFVDTRCRLLPFLSTNGYPTGESQIIDHQKVQMFFGEVLEHETCGQVEGFYPFEDISSGRDPVSFLKDEGITAYPQVMLNPNFLDPGAMNGIIEPLSVRGTLPGASIDSPFVAHTVRADIGVGFQSGEFIHQYVYHGFYNVPDKNRCTAYIDSQDTRMSVGDFSLGVDGIADFGVTEVSPFDGSEGFANLENDLMVQDESDFNDFIGLGIISKMTMNTVYDYDRDRSVERGKTGIRNVTNVTSLAFGGLMN